MTVEPRASEMLHTRTILELSQEVGLKEMARAASGINTSGEMAEIETSLARQWAKGKADPDHLQFGRLVELDYLYDRLGDCDIPQGLVDWLEGYIGNYYPDKVRRLSLLQQDRFEELEKEMRIELGESES